MRCVINHTAIIYYNMNCILHDSATPLSIQMQNAGHLTRGGCAPATIDTTAPSQSQIADAQQG